jgi:alpha-D-ribose 1-methylphosphonate 5-triphosphate synthase subunit PhnG
MSAPALLLRISNYSLSGGYVPDSVSFTQSEYLSVLSQAPADAVKALAEEILPSVEPITVLTNRTGLVMLPYTDNAKGTIFHLGEVLVAEAHIRLGVDECGVEGYGMCLGRDLVQAMAIAVLDAAVTANSNVDTIMAFVSAHTARLAAADDQLLCSVESTRVEMQTF